jgi:trigger factor
MPYTVEETGNLTRTAQVTVPNAEYQKDVNKALRKLAGRVKIRGFRKGKIPMSVLRKRYGDSVQRDVIESLVNKYVDQIVEETDDILHVDQPRVTGFQEGDDVGLAFEIDFELRPDVDPIGYLGVKVDKPKAEIDTEAIDEQLEQMRKQFSTLEPIELRKTIKEGDVVTFDFRATDEEDPELEDFQGEGAQVTIGEGNALPGIEEALTGAEFDASVTTMVTPGDNFQVEELRNKEFELQIDVKSVKQRVLPELDDDFAQDTGEAETLLELRQKVRESLAEQQEHEALHYAENELIDQLLEQHEFDIPPAFLQRQIDSKINQQLRQLQQQGLDVENLGLDMDELRDQLRDETSNQLRAEFLLMAIAEKENLEVDNDDLQAFFMHQAQHSGVSPQQLMQYYQADQNRLQQAAGSALLEKTVKFLLDEADFNEIDWPTEEELEAKAAEAASKKAEKATKEAVKEADEEAAEQLSEAESVAAVEGATEDHREAFESLTVSELKDLLRDADLKVSGRKAELVDRLLDAGVTPD